MRRFVVGLSMLALALAPIAFGVACWDAGPGPLRASPGPTPTLPAGSKFKRYLQARGSPNVRHDRVVWDLGNGAVDPWDAVKGLQAKIPDELWCRLRDPEPQPRQPGAPRTTPYPMGWATVVSLDPHVVVISIRETPLDTPSYEHVFSKFEETHVWKWWSKEKADRFRVDNVGQFVHDFIPIYCCAGDLVPWSEEMYVVSQSEGAESRWLKFDREEAVVELPKGRLRLRREKDTARVTREP